MLARAGETDADSIVPDVEFGYGNTQKLPNMFDQHHLSAELVIEDGERGFCYDVTSGNFMVGRWCASPLAKKYYTVQQASYSKFNSE